MTDEQKQRLSAHLAEHVCGWTRDGDTYQMSNGGTWPVCQWEPLDDVRHTEAVMRAWAKKGTYCIESTPGAGVGVVACPGRAGGLSGFSHSNDWREAVCLAIGWASGWEEQTKEKEE